MRLWSGRQHLLPAHFHLSDHLWSARYQMHSREPFFYPERYLKIDNTALEPEVVARQIAARFSLAPDSAD